MLALLHTIAAGLFGMSAAAYLLGVSETDATLIICAIITTAGGAFASIAAAFVSRGLRHELTDHRQQLQRVEELSKAPRRIGATAGDHDPVLQPPENDDQDGEHGG